jgi:hypothetical protein
MRPDRASHDRSVLVLFRSDPEFVLSKAKTDSASVGPEELFRVDRRGDDELAQMEDHGSRVSFRARNQAHRVVERRACADRDGQQTMPTGRVHPAGRRTFTVVLPVLREIKASSQGRYRELRDVSCRCTLDDSRWGTSKVDCSSNLTSTFIAVCSLGSPGLTCGVCSECENTAGVNAF